jgi:hypothetical protein
MKELRLQQSERGQFVCLRSEFAQERLFAKGLSSTPRGILFDLLEDDH